MAGQGFKIADGYIDVVAEVDHSDIQHRVQAAVASISNSARTVKLLGDLTASALATKVKQAINAVPKAARTVEILGEMPVTLLSLKISTALNLVPKASRTIDLFVDIDLVDLTAKIEMAIRMIPASARTITLNIDIDMGAALLQLMGLLALLRSLGGSLGGLGGGGGLGSLFGSFTSLLNPVGLVAAAIGAAVAAALSLFAVLTLLAPIVYTIGGLLGGMTTLAFGAAGALAVVALGLRGAGSAIKQMVTEGKVANDVLAKLAPNAREFVLALKPVKGILDDLSKRMQQRLFAGMAGEIKALIERFGVLWPFLDMIADGINHIGRAILSAFSEYRTIERIATIFQGMALFLDLAAAAVKPFLTALVQIGEAAIPVVLQLGRGLVDLSNRFAVWIAQADKTGALQNFFVEAAAAMRDLVHIGGLVGTIVGQLIGILFPTSKEVSGSIFSGIRDALQGVSDWLAKPENQDGVRRFVDQAVVAFRWLKDEGVPMVQEWIRIVDEEWVPTIEGWIATVEGWIATVEGWGLTIVGWIDTVNGWKNTIVGIIAEIEAFPGRVGTAFANLWTIISSPFINAWATVQSTTTTAIETTVASVTTLPGRIGAGISGLPGTIDAAFSNARDAAVSRASDLVNTTTSNLSTLAGRAGAALSGLAGQIGAQLSNAANTAGARAWDIVNSVTGTLASLPGRAAGAVSGLAGQIAGAMSGAIGEAGRIGSAIVDGMVSGVRSAAGRLVDAARDVAGGALAAAKRMLDIRSPSRVFRDQVGRMIPAGIELGIKAGMPDLQRTMRGLLPSMSPVALTATAPSSAMLATSPTPASAPARLGGVERHEHIHLAPGAVTFAIDASELRTRQQLDRYMSELAIAARTMTAGAR